MIKQGLRDLIAECYNENAIMFDNPSFDDSVVGISTDGRVVYSLTKMVEELSEDENICFEDSLDFIDYNTIRILNYLDKDNRPIIMEDMLYD